MNLLPAFVGALCVISGLAMLGNRAGYFYLVICPRSLVTLAVIAAAGGWFLSGAHAQEIKPTRGMIATASRILKDQNKDYPDTKYEFHFRNVEGHILYCAYVTGGNGGFCEKVAPASVAAADRAASELCKTPDGEGGVPHAVYGELYDLDYKCVKGRSTRLPVDYALDRDSYVRSQWKPLP
jgi:hypothetical protein